jgi:uncharacterized protein (TIGR02246 family)
VVFKSSSGAAENAAYIFPNYRNGESLMFSWMFRSLPLIIVLLLSSCATTDTEAKKSAPDPNADRAALNKLRGDWVTAFNAGDTQGIAATYSENAVLMPQNQEPVMGRAAIEAYYKALYGQASAKISLTSQEVVMIGEDAALDRGTYVLSITPKAGATPIEDAGKYLVILQRQSDGTWKATRDIDNSSRPMPPGIGFRGMNEE